MIAPSAIHLQEVSKSYGKRRGILDLNLEVRPGEIFGYLGPNGAGKTTTIRLLLDLIRPNCGEVRVLGHDVRAAGASLRRRIGYLPGELVLYEQLTGRELLTYFAHLRGGVDWAYVDRLARQLEVELKRPIRSLSKGNKQKVGILQAMIHRPDLLILDEPTSGLDPLVQQAFYAIIREVRSEGRTVFLSSHVIAEVEQVCDRVGIIREGRLELIEAVTTLKTRAQRDVTVAFGGPVRAQAFHALPGIHDLTLVDGVLHCSVTGSIDTLIKAIAPFEVVTMAIREPDLEEIFLGYYQEVPHAA